MNNHQDIILACTGASGAIYNRYILHYLMTTQHFSCVHVLMSAAARVVWQQELDISIPAEPQAQALVLSQIVDIHEQYATNIRCYHEQDWFSPTASGSSGLRKMVIIPCSMGSLARIATGMSHNLIERAADVMLKEGGTLLIVPRETPLSVIHIENMLTLARLGVIIMPAMPSWYHRPQTLNEFAERFAQRVLDRCGIETAMPDELRWGQKNEK